MITSIANPQVKELLQLQKKRKGCFYRRRREDVPGGAEGSD